MREGHSWSGHEANVCFVNKGGKGFADASSVSGFGLSDDSRGIAVIDWDDDGDLDLWLTNRNAPMVRFLENRASDSQRSSSMSVSLQGVRSNRDAIGARATLTLSNGREITRAVRAGHGYLSQSSKRLHFAWPTNEKASILRITWPNSPPSIHEIANHGRSVQIVEGSDSKVSDTPRVTLKSTGSPANSPLPARVISLARPWFPSVAGLKHERPLLVQLSASWCAPCLAERQAFARAADAVKSAGLEVLSVNVDGISPSDYPFPQIVATDEWLDALEVMQRSLFDHSTPLKLPLCLLLDKESRLVCWYPGAVTPGQVIQDLALMSEKSDQLLQQALPFRGPWLNPPSAMDPINIATNFFAAGKLKPALDYLDRLIAYLESNPDTVGLNRAKIEAVLGRMLDSGAMLLNPKDIKLLRELGLHYLKERNVERAFPLLLQAVAREPTDRTTLFGLAQIYFATDDLPAAIKTLRVLTQHHPDHVSGVNNLAWILATHPDDALRDGKEALRLALTLPVKTEASYADTLAAALAETGAFEEALELILTVLPGAEDSLREKLTQRRQAYEQRQPWRSN
jgi:tetratricopeptide (TPR) repeat protein